MLDVGCTVNRNKNGIAMWIWSNRSWNDRSNQLQLKTHQLSIKINSLTFVWQQAISTRIRSVSTPYAIDIENLFKKKSHFISWSIYLSSFNIVVSISQAINRQKAMISNEEITCKPAVYYKLLFLFVFTTEHSCRFDSLTKRKSL